MFADVRMNVGGKIVSIPIELNRAQIKEVYETASSMAVADRFGEPEIGQMGYYEDEFGEIVGFEVTEDQLEFAKNLYEKDNFFLDEQIAKDLIRCDSIIRRVRHFSEMTRKKDINFKKEGGYTITYNYVDKCLECGLTGNWLALGDIVFDTEEAAHRAMTKFAKDLIWYFTNVKSNLRYGG